MSDGNADEEVLRHIWCAALNLDHAGDDQNFFAEGGDSLAAIDMLDEIDDRLGWEVPVETLFKHGTFAHLRDALLAHRSAEDASG